jgi:Holliday junction resolvasome RuvABC endonuclease subunit
VIALGIDCATKCGWALVEGPPGAERLLSHGVLSLGGKMPSWKTIAGLVQRVQGNTPRLDVVAIELPWLGKNAQTTIRLATLCGQFRQAFGPVAEDDVSVVRATEWQSKILGRLGGKTRDTLKPAAVLWARGAFGVKLSEDEADAAGIAVHLLRKRAWADRVNRARRRA